MKGFFHATVILWVIGLSVVAQDVAYFPGTTYKIVQLTGDCDTTRRIPTLSRTESIASISKTDLGSTFEHNGQLYFLFGDTPYILGGNGFDDFVARTDKTQPADVVLTDFHKLGIPGVSLGVFEVPSGGISINGSIYIVATTDHYAVENGIDSNNQVIYNDFMGRSSVAVSGNDGNSFEKLYDLSSANVVFDTSTEEKRKHAVGLATNASANFINVSMVEEDGRQFPNMPAEQCVLVWGSGLYRKSNVRLAYVPSVHIGDSNKLAYRYFTGVVGGVPQWSVNEFEAVDLFNEVGNTGNPIIGEFSVTYCAQLAKWIMLYGDAEIRMRSADRPWGPWSGSPVVIFHRDTDNAFGNYAHKVGFDIISDPPPYLPGDNWGSAYGPYLIRRFFEGDQNRVKIVYAMSTWNPYQVILMQSDIGYPVPNRRDDVARIVTLPGSEIAGWSVTGNFLQHTFNAPIKSGGPNVRYSTSYGNNREADMGVAQYQFLVSDADQALEFSVRGGDAEIVLIEQPHGFSLDSIPNVGAFYDELKAGNYGKVIECVFGPQNSEPISVRWGLRRHRGKTMGLIVVDSKSGNWGFVDVSEVSRCLGPTVTAAYGAATTLMSNPNLIIRPGNYTETMTANKPATLSADLSADGAAVSIGR